MIETLKKRGVDFYFKSISKLEVSISHTLLLPWVFYHILGVFEKWFSWMTKGYKYGVLHEPLFEIVDNRTLRYLLEEDHVVHSAGLDIVTLPMVRLEKKYHNILVTLYANYSILIIAVYKTRLYSEFFKVFYHTSYWYYIILSDNH